MLGWPFGLQVSGLGGDDVGPVWGAGSPVAGAVKVSLLDAVQVVLHPGGAGLRGGHGVHPVGDLDVGAACGVVDEADGLGGLECSGDDRLRFGGVAEDDGDDLAVGHAGDSMRAGRRKHRQGGGTSG